MVSLLPILSSSNNQHFISTVIYYLGKAKEKSSMKVRYLQRIRFQKKKTQSGKSNLKVIYTYFAVNYTINKNKSFGKQ